MEPVVARVTTERSGRADFPWMLLGVHAARMDVSNRDSNEDERLNLNCACTFGNQAVRIQRSQRR